MHPTALYLTALSELDVMEREELDRRLDHERTWRWPIGRPTSSPDVPGHATDRLRIDGSPPDYPLLRRLPILSRLTRPA